ncbi:hypothetical protein [Microbacterium sp. MMO-56]|uniref:hypothetical protein n=1 Tax=Microbacterium sp. MMO-56 TaxID=3081281 RepID=UPI003015A635
MSFPAGVTVVRLRAKPVLDPYSQKQVGADWSDPDTLELPGSYVGQSSTARTLGASRTQILESRSLYCDPDLDVQALDKIQHGTVVYDIDGFPDVEVNPFTGWSPVREIPLRRAAG